MKNQYPLSKSIASFLPGRAGLLALSTVAVLGFGHPPSAMAVMEDHLSGAFTVGSNDADPFVPSVSVNLLAKPAVTFNASKGAFVGENTSGTYSVLTNGLFGVIPSPGGGGPGAVGIFDNTSLTYTFGSNFGYHLSLIDVFSGWGDGGRLNPNVSVSYATTAAPTTWVSLQSINYAADPGSNVTQVHISDLGLNTTAVKAVRFDFGPQQNGYVGYTELAVQGSFVGTSWIGGTSSDWGNGANWQGNLVPDAGAAVSFGEAESNANVNLVTSGYTVGEIAFSSAVGTTIGGTKTLTLANGTTGVQINADGNHAISVPVALSSSAAFALSSGSTLTVNGNITENSAGKSVSLAGTGTLVLNGAGNSYTGGTNVTGGTILAGVDNALPTGSAVTLGDGSTLDLNGHNQTVSTLGGAGTVRSSAAGTSTLTVSSGTLAATLASGVGALALAKVGTGTTVLNSFSNTYTGGTSITAGRLEAGGSSAYSPLGTGTVTLSGGTLALTGQLIGGLLGQYYDRNPQNGDQGAFNTKATLDALLDPLTPTVAVQTTTGGQTDLSFTNGGNFGGNPPFANQGFTVADNLETRMSGKIYLAQSGTYNFATTSDDGSMLFIDGATVVSNNNFQGATRHTGTANLSAGFHDIEIGFYEGTGGAGLLVEYTPIGGTNQPIPNSVLVKDTTTFSSTQNLSNNVVVNGNSTIEVTGSLTAKMGTLTIGGNTLSVTGANNSKLSLASTSLAGNATLDTAANTTLIVGSISAAGAQTLTKNGSGTLDARFAGAYSGGTTVNGGTVLIGDDAALGTGDVTLAGGSVLSFGVGASGLHEGLLSGSFNKTDANNNLAIQSSTRLANSTSNVAYSPTGGGVPDNSTVIYTGLLNNSASVGSNWTFAETLTTTSTWPLMERKS